MKVCGTAKPVILERGAVLSECGTWRLELRRIWELDRPLLGVFGLNPSTATAEVDDPTVKKLVGFASRWGFGGFVLGNLFAYRATDPKEVRDLLRAGKFDLAQGPRGLEAIDSIARECDALLAAWGSSDWARPRARAVRVILEGTGRNGVVRRPIFCLRKTVAGDPWHPLYVPYSKEPERWN